jgi:hypothetical protein
MRPSEVRGLRAFLADQRLRDAVSASRYFFFFVRSAMIFS